MERIIGRLQDGWAQAKFIGESPAFQAAIQQLPAIAGSDASVLIGGETGTGKELVSRAIHHMSERALFPFVSVNCGSLPETLLESELFGHERGAFTGAHAQQRGIISLANGGTLFLDEIDTLSLRAQVALLRVLQDKRFRPVGAANEMEVDMRVIAATNKPLEKLVATGEFREDLLYRLCVFSVFLPPLRVRKEDIFALAAHFIQKHAPSGKEFKRLAPAAIQALISHDWPGNVRELENAIIRGLHLSTFSLIEVDDLKISTPSQPSFEMPVAASEKLGPFKAMKKRMIEAFEVDYLARLMQTHAGNVTQAAKTSGKERRDLGKLLKKHGFNPQHFRG